MTGARGSLGHGHRRQNSTPAPYETAAPAKLNSILRSHGHRRGQTVDHGSIDLNVDLGHQKSIADLRGYYNHCQTPRTVQHPNCIPQAEQTFISSAQRPARQSNIYLPASTIRSEGQAFNQEQLQAIHAPASESTSTSFHDAPSFSQTNSRYPGSAFQAFGLEQLLVNELFRQQNLHMTQNGHTAGYHRSMHEVSVQPEASPDKPHAYVPTSRKIPRLTIN